MCTAFFMILDQFAAWTATLGVLLHGDSDYYYGGPSMSAFWITTSLNVSYAADEPMVDDDDGGGGGDDVD